MPTLSSLLVQREIATMRAVENAISRQVLHGGDLPTNLLELGAVNEPALARVLGESIGLEPAAAGRLPAPDASVLRMVPGELALRHGIFPLSVEGRVLVVATSEPISAGVEEDLSFALDAAVRGLAAPLVRIREALGTYYDIPVDRRLARLLAKLDGTQDPSPSSRPPYPLRSRSSRPKQGPVLGTFGTGVPPAPSRGASARAGGFPAPDVTVIPSTPELPSLGLGAYSEGAAALAPPPAHVATGSWPAAAVSPTVPSPVPSVPAATPPSVLEHFIRRVTPAAKTTATARPRRKGPFTAAMAEGELEHATATDAVLDVLFDFAHQYFEYAALFVVHGEQAEGRDAIGPGADRAKVITLGLPLDVASVLATARERRGPVVARLGQKGLDGELAIELGRPGAYSAAVAVVPVVVRGRTVAILYGDDGEVGVELAALAELVAFAGVSAGALERVILLRKRAAPRPVEKVIPRPPPARPAAPRPDLQGGAAALARAFGVGDAPPTAEAETPAAPAFVAPAPVARVEPTRPMPQVSAGASSVFPAAPDGAPPARRASDPPAHEADGLDAGWGARSERRPFDTATRPEVPRAKRGEEVAIPYGAPGAPAASSDAGRPAGSARNDDGAEATPDDRDKFTVPGHRAAMASVLGGRTAAESAGGHATAGLVFSEAPPPPPPVDVDSAGLVTALVRAGADREALVRAIVADPAPSLAAVAAAFPGPLTVDRHRVRDQIPAAARCGPLLELVVALGAGALPLLVVHASAPDAEVRFWAAHALGELPFAAAAGALLQRLFDEDVSVRRVARRAATALLAARESAPILAGGLDQVARDAAEPSDRRVLAVDTMGEMRTGAVVPGLIAVLTDPSTETSDAARRALSLVTRQDFGRDPNRWSEWWAANAGRHRVEWLVDALMHELPSMRRAAGDELKHLTREYFGYYDDLPKKERERAQARYREWWDREGHKRFRD